MTLRVPPITRWCGPDGAPLAERLAALDAWCADILAEAATGVRVEVVADPVDLGELPEPARSYAAALAERHDLTDPAVVAAVAAVVRGTDADSTLSLADATLLREASAAALGRILEAGVEVVGARDALLWPLPAVDGRVPLAVAAEAAAAVLAVRKGES